LQKQHGKHTLLVIGRSRTAGKQTVLLWDSAEKLEWALIAARLTTQPKSYDPENSEDRSQETEFSKALNCFHAGAQMNIEHRTSNIEF